MPEPVIPFSPLPFAEWATNNLQGGDPDAGYADYQREQLPADRETYAEAEVEARQRRIGLWADPHAEAPWQYRKKKRERS